MKLLVFIALTLAFFAVPSLLFASENQFVTIVNPVRISPYTKNSAESIKAQYHVISSNNLPATWLLRYDVLKNDADISVIQTMDDRQELGIFMEVTKELAEDAGVVYPDNASWHHANAVFLSGYSQSDRVKMIDVVFEKFHQKFGYYPKSIGSWWTDAYSLSYMKETYGITANLTCSDQFATDGYQIWGQYWMYPYYPSKNHAGIPGYDAESQIDIVTIQWAPRDPLNGYESSLYSTQDYHVSPVNQDFEYFKKLFEMYGLRHKNAFSQITLGLEGDFNPGTYGQHYKQQMDFISEMINEGKITSLTMTDFSEWYRHSFKQTPFTFFQENDLLVAPVKSFWYQSQRYRIHFVMNEDTNEVTINDFRTYHSDLIEPYYYSPNNNHKLSIYIPSYFDAANDNTNIWSFTFGGLKDVISQNNAIEIVFNEGTLLLTPDKITIRNTSLDVPSELRLSKALLTRKYKDEITIYPTNHWIVGRDGLTFRGLTEPAMHELLRKRTLGALSLMVMLYLIVCIITVIRRSHIVLKSVFIVFPVIFFSLFANFWYQKNSETLYVSQSEIDVLSHLSLEAPGRVLVYDKECLGCQWHTRDKPAVFANRREYVSWQSKHKIVYNKLFFESKNLEQVKNEFQKLDVTYIYLVQYEGMQEVLPFSPGDFNLEKIYANANGEIWRVKRPSI